VHRRLPEWFGGLVILSMFVVVVELCSLINHITVLMHDMM
jgi:hypothetical protein